MTSRKVRSECGATFKWFFYANGANFCRSPFRVAHRIMKTFLWRKFHYISLPSLSLSLSHSCFYSRALCLWAAFLLIWLCVVIGERPKKKLASHYEKFINSKSLPFISFLIRLHFFDCAESRRRELSSPRRNSEVELLTPEADKSRNIYACECVLLFFLEIRGKKLQLCVNLKGKHDKQSRKVPLGSTKSAPH